MTALKILLAGAMAAGVVTLAGAPAAQADPLNPGQTHYLSNEPGDTRCADTGCQQPRATPPRGPRGVIGCVRGVCIPKPNRPSATR